MSVHGVRHSRKNTAGLAIIFEGYSAVSKRVIFQAHRDFDTFIGSRGTQRDCFT